MKWQTRTLLGIALLMWALLLVACGSREGDVAASGGVTLDEYFQRLGTVQQDLVARNATLSDEMMLAPSSSEDENLMALKGAMQGMKDFTDESYETLKAIPPPEEVREHHEKYLAAVADAQALFAEVFAGLEQADTWTEAVESLGMFFPDRFNPIKERVDESCLALQSVADSNAIEADLMCI